MWPSARSSGAPGAGGPGGGGGSLDYDAEARRLWLRLGLHEGAEAGAGVGVQSRYHALDPIWKHPQTGARIYVGNQSAAADASMLAQHGITHVVNCTDNIPCFHEGKGAFQYYRFDVAWWWRHVDGSHASTAMFVAPMLAFVYNKALCQGHSVLVHCLAGAHRAGTTGTLLLMVLENMRPREAVTVAKMCRPIIDPIGNFPEFLNRVDAAVASGVLPTPKGHSAAETK
ncbi:dual specificity phosphatase 10 [Pycnococcus provasolii]|uniref:protein-tyrosine-phosphatase n=1 Tax=Pycnococcus provasolii TaxID=41880 RepID=A0A6U0BNP4_9CHLO|nr:dual specificity phosphatase 10 [Pycnococcus provasolii]|mmetsp:Transcript_3938/g.8889  ORF Transcript_3938/g.8889 Transcript_3938/m.8889 type:complete len:228 (-) Transcript_3938:124-807(-)|eukprot:CAMPEP_0205960184 /NCGR_PEP_ID=MMETSP1459-20131121/60150_1 /ASSEMBLY_ACC=CAM_ASM_001120 /TAXON_ID=41880 /ORGANISM="Pycnococcus provasolii, Strain RCC931" /LENGTH=227 /DNA_ID=CAMNT_0053332819 /DNA_START=39 /DNA_END=722 /DNA_ORIENTATION=+